MASLNAIQHDIARSGMAMSLLQVISAVEGEASFGQHLILEIPEPRNAVS
jgi:hypothetical protein